MNGSEKRNGGLRRANPSASGATKTRTEKRSATRTLGPVPDLERHLPAEWWRGIFNSLYLRTDGDVVENQTNTAREVDLLVQAVGLQPGDNVIDLCCGQGRHSLELARRGFKHVTGIDRSRYLVRLGRRRAREQNVTVSFHEGDARRFRAAESSVDCVAILGNSFGYFDRVEDDHQVLRSALRALRSGGAIALDLVDGDWMREHFERRSWEWIDEDQLVCRERSLSSEGDRLISREVVVHAERGVLVDQFYAERLYAKSDIERQLLEAGFLNVRFHGELIPESERGADLGMMAHRFFVTARAPHKDPPKTKRKSRSRVTVLLGDPRLPDSVKRNGEFNPEDLDTIERLRRALAELSEYEFEYLDNHETLIPALRSNPPSLVLNLCDEGFDNDAFKELHVPALLEMLGTPYTGAGPACLGTAYDKAIVRACAASLDIPVPAETYCTSDDQGATLPTVFPAILKPNFGDSSIGITQEAVVHQPRELVAYFERLRSELPGRPILVQEFLSGAEYSVGIIGNPGLGYRFLPVLEVDYSNLPGELPQISGYEAKWLPDSPYWKGLVHREAQLDPEQARDLCDWSALLFERLRCRDYARVDFRADAQGQIKLLEVNPNPGWCWDGKLNLMAGFEGLRYADLMRLILKAAQRRIAFEREQSAVQASATDRMAHEEGKVGVGVG